MIRAYLAWLFWSIAGTRCPVCCERLRGARTWGHYQTCTGWAATR